MADAPESGSNRRRHRRYPARKSVRTVSKNQRHEGELKDISAGGAAVQPTGQFEIGDAVEVDIEDVGTFPAHVARTNEDDMFAVTFDEDNEDDLLAEITRIHDGLLDEEI